MKWGRVADTDSLFRLSTHPIAFKIQKKKLVFASAKVMNIKKQDDGSWASSFAWERYVPTTELVHDYGCRLSLGINNAARNSGTYEDSTRNIYCGAYQLRASDVRELPTAVDDVVSADVYHLIENDEFAHAHLRVILGGKLPIEGTKTAILVRLWEACYGPLTHVCDCDKQIDPHPYLALEPGPQGPYHDTRSRFERWRAVMGFRVCNWLWQKFFR